jgi:hypothetical protein
VSQGAATTDTHGDAMQLEEGYMDRQGRWGDEQALAGAYPMDIVIGLRFPVAEIGDLPLWVDLNGRHIFSTEGRLPVGQGIALGVRLVPGD